MKVVLNRSVGARISISVAGINRLVELKGPVGLIGKEGRPSERSNLFYSLPRNDKDLVQVVEELGMAASEYDAELTVVEIPDNASWSISDIVGYEFVNIGGERYEP